MKSWFLHFDELLRGHRTNAELLVDSGRILPLSRFLPMAIVLAAVYGSFMGWFAVASRGWSEGSMQLLASTVKLPALFVLTLLVTLPSLYVFSALVGFRLSCLATLRLLIGAVAVNGAVLASLGSILAFFTLSTVESYHFIVFLNVTFMAFGGIVSLSFLMRALRGLFASPSTDVPAASPVDTDEQETPASAPPANQDDGAGAIKFTFSVWIIIYGLVGAQMGWLLRPFIGSPDLPFEWFRTRQGNFYLSLLDHIGKLLGTEG